MQEEIEDLPFATGSKSFASKIQPAPKENWLVVDAINLGFRYAHKGQSGFIDDYIATVYSLAKSYNCGTIFIVCDKGSSTYRKNVYPEYKANRKEKFEQQTSEEKAKFEKFFEEFERLLTCLPENWILLRYPGVEADDIAAYLSKQTNFNKMWLISSDRDYDLLITDKVSRFSYVTRKEVTINNFFDTYNCIPESYVGLKALQGDNSDNIKGVDGIGPKRAIQLLEQYDDIYGLMDALPIKGTQKFISNLNSSEDILIRNLELMDLTTYCEDAIGAENIEDIRKRSIFYG